MSNPGLKSRRVTSIVGCYSLALLSVAAATALTFPLQDFDVRVSLFFPAVLLATWFGGTGPGLFAVLLSTLSINFFFTKPPLQFQFGVQDIPNLVAFLFAALLISSWSTARKRAEKRLRESQDELRKARDELENKVIERTAELSGSNEQFRNLVNTIDGIVWEADAQTFRFTFVGDQAERILGYPVKQWLREPTFWKDHLHPEDRDWAVQFCVNATTEKRDHDFEYRMIAADGRIVWVRDLVTVVVEDGHPARLRGVMVDTTNRKRAEEAVRHSEKQLRDLVEAMPAMAFVSRPDGTNEFVSRGWIEFSGLSAEQTAGSGWEAPLHPDDREQHLVKWRASLASGEPFENEARHRDAQGNYRWLLVRAVPLRDEHGSVLKWYGAVTDIEDRKRAEALLAGEKRILEMVAKGDPLSQILDTLCRMVEEQATDVLASILLLDGNRLRHGGAPSLPKPYTDAIDGAVIGPRVGSCGTAAFTAKQVIVTDIATDPLWKDYRAAALPHSLRACWSTPVFSSQGKVIATFAMYYREPRSPSLSDQQIIEQITHLAGIAIERKLIEDKLSQSEAYLTEAQQLTHTGSFVWDLKTKKALYLSDEWYRIYGFDRNTGEYAWHERLKRIHPDDLHKWQAAVDRAISEKSDYEVEYRLVLPNGVTKYVHSVGHPVSNSSGDVVHFMGSVTDITERKRAEALLAGEKRLLEMIATGVPLKEILNTLCLIIEEQRSGTLASVLLQNPDGVHLNVVAAPNLPNDWIEQMEKLPIGPCAGSCGTAAFRGSPVIVSDIATDSLWDVPEHRAAALQHGLRASWSNPVVSPNGKVLGTFCIYHREPRSPNTQDFELIELATHVARVAIERDRAEEALRTSEELARSHVEVMMRSLDVLATEAAPEKFIAEMLRTIGQRLRASSVLLWLRNRQDDSLRLQLVIENDQQIAPYPDHPFVKDPHSWKGNPYFQEMFFTRGPVVCEDIEHDPRIGADFREYLIKRGRKRFMAIPMFVLGEVRGFIGIQHVEGGTYRPDEIELAQALAHHVMMAAHGAELAEQRRHAIVLEERTRMARDIHDTLAQGFTGVIVQLEAAEDATACGSRKDADKHLRRASELARRSLSEARRSVHALRPQALREHNFWDALKGTIKNTTAGTPLHTTFQAQGKIPELPPTWQENLLRIGQEALTNTLKYAHARKFETRLNYKAKELRLELRDDGDGFKMKDRHDGVGLTGMRERVEQMGGELKISSSHGKGTKITVVLPCNGELTS
jgi:PAS domain S-box-containing protein